MKTEQVRKLEQVRKFEELVPGHMRLEPVRRQLEQVERRQELAQLRSFVVVERMQPELALVRRRERAEHRLALVARMQERKRQGPEQGRFRSFVVVVGRTRAVQLHNFVGELGRDKMLALVHKLELEAEAALCKLVREHKRELELVYTRVHRPVAEAGRQWAAERRLPAADGDMPAAGRR
jgi:hypothetical protein